MILRSCPVTLRIWGPPTLIACIACCAIAVSLDPAGDYPDARQGPGLTLDECFNVQQGVFLAEAMRSYGLSILHPDSVNEVFGGPAYLPDHPPLGRLWIGLCHNAVRYLVPPGDTDRFCVTACARAASAIVFAALVILVGGISAKWYGPQAGWATAIAIVLMPRLFGHAHLASLETAIGLTYAAAVLCVAHSWSRESAPSKLVACVTGVVFGLALLTKIQAILIPPVLAVWALFHWKRRAVVPLAVWGCVAGVVFFCFWPWLWLDPVDHLLEYFGRTTNRVQLSVWYFGQKYADLDVPWHYPAVLFLTTVPVGLHLLAAVGLVCGKRLAWRERREQLVLGCLLLPLVVFSLPGVAVYDGSRLFLVAFPLWALLVGRGSPAVIEWLKRRMRPRLAYGLFGGCLLMQGWGLVTLSPCYLSYYNVLLGGLDGADRLGMEPTYWGDSLTRQFLAETVAAVPQDETIAATPALYTFQWDELLSQSPLLRQNGIRFRRFGTPEAAGCRYLLLFRRKADLPAWLQDGPTAAPRLAEVRRQGVVLAGLYDLAPAASDAALAPAESAADRMAHDKWPNP